VLDVSQPEPESPPSTSPTKPNSDRLAWLDLEMTGLDTARHTIVEIAVTVEIAATVEIAVTAEIAATAVTAQRHGLPPPRRRRKSCPRRPRQPRRARP
jgi:hypothetical protein